MAIISYLVFPVEGKSEEMKQSLSEIPNSELIPAQNHDMCVFVTDTKSEDEEVVVQASIKRIETIQTISLVYGELSKTTNDSDLVGKSRNNEMHSEGTC